MTAADGEPAPILLYDGVCGLCNRFVQIVLDHDPEGRFRFAPLQSRLASAALARHGLDPSVLSTVVVVLDHERPTERLLTKSRAALFVLKSLGGAWNLLRPFGLLPTAVLDLAYDGVARNRYRVFGRSETCRMPKPEQRARFLDGVSDRAEG